MWDAKQQATLGGRCRRMRLAPGPRLPWLARVRASKNSRRSSVRPAATGHMPCGSSGQLYSCYAGGRLWRAVQSLSWANALHRQPQGALGTNPRAGVAATAPGPSEALLLVVARACALASPLSTDLHASVGCRPAAPYKGTRKNSLDLRRHAALANLIEINAALEAATTRPTALAA